MLEVKIVATEEVRGLRHQTPVESVCVMMASPIVTASLVGEEVHEDGSEGREVAVSSATKGDVLRPWV